MKKDAGTPGNGEPGDEEGGSDMKLYYVKLTSDALMNYFLAAPEITREMRQKYRYIQEVGDIPGVDGKTYEAGVRLKRKTKQASMFDG
jgi:hypothetical protein